MLNIRQRNVIRGYLDEGMSPEDIADYIGRINDLGPLEVVTIRSAAYDMLNEHTSVGPDLSGHRRRPGAGHGGGADLVLRATVWASLCAQPCVEGGRLRAERHRPKGGCSRRNCRWCR